MALALIGTTVFASIVNAPTIIGEKGNAEQGNERITSHQVSYTREELKQALADLAKKYGGNYYTLYQCITNESGFIYDATGDGGLAYGVAQFHKATFNALCKGNYFSPIDQLECFVRLNYKAPDLNWSCWKFINS